MIFVDSSVWIAHFNGGTEPAAQRLEGILAADEPVCIADIVATEVLHGFRRDRDFELARRALAGVDRLVLSHATYVNAARLYRRLRTRGVTPKTVDCIIGQACIEAAVSLLTSDGDFAGIARHTRLRLVDH